MQITDTVRDRPFVACEFLTHPLTHAGVIAGMGWCLWTSFGLVTGLFQLASALLIAYFWVDIVSAVLHFASDNLEVNDEGKTIIGGHHNDPLNYLDLTVSEKFAVSYIGLIPMLAIQLAVGPAIPYLYLVNSLAMPMASTVAIVHDAAHRAKFGLYLPWIVVKLQDYGIIMTDQSHMRHHRDPNCDYGFFHGKTDPLTNLFLTRWSIQPALGPKDFQEIQKNITKRMGQHGRFLK
jgi:hypothetical protein